jgi:ATP-dependent Lhr-like helicase
VLRTLGDLPLEELQKRCQTPEALEDWLATLLRERRVMVIRVAGVPRYAAAEDAARYRDGLGVALPVGLPDAFLEDVADPVGDLVARYARTHAPFPADAAARQLGLGVATVQAVLRRLQQEERVLEGEFLPGGTGREWVDAGVLQTLKRRCLARLCKQVESVEQEAFSRFLLSWQGVTRPAKGPDALMAAVEQLQGAAIAVSELEADVFGVRVREFERADLDALCAAGEVVWRGVEPLGPHDGRVALYLADFAAALCPPPLPVKGDLAKRVLEQLEVKGAQFFADIQRHTGAFGLDVMQALWELVWAGHVTNDTLAPLRSLAAGKRSGAQRLQARMVRMRRAGPPGSEGRWSLLRRAPVPETERRMALCQQLLRRHGVLTREAVHAEEVAGGFSAIYDVLKAMEDAGRVRRGYFVTGLGATQFALPGADDRLRSARNAKDDGGHTVVLAANDPAQPFGAALPWPEGAGTRPVRAAGAWVVLHDGALLAYVGKTARSLHTYFRGNLGEQEVAAQQVAKALARLVESGRRRAVWLTEVDGALVSHGVMAEALVAAGFRCGSRGFLRKAVVVG